MPGPTPFPIKQEAIQLYFSGYSNKEVAKKIGKGTGNVSNIYNEFIKECEKIGIEDAVEKYGLEDTLDNLHDTSVALKDAKVDVDRAKAGAELIKKLSGIGVELDEVDDFVKKLVVASKEYPIGKIVECAKSLSDLEAKHHKKYGDIVKDYETKAEELPVLREQSKRLQKEVKQVEFDLEKKLNAVKVTERHLEDYLKVKDSLAKHGMKFQDIESISTVLDNVKEHNHDYRKIMKTVKDTENVAKKLKDLTQEVEDKKEEVNSFSGTIKEYRELHREYNKLREHGLTLANARKLNIIAERYSTPEEFLGEMMGAYEQYGGLLGIQKERKKLEKEVEEAQIKLNLIMAKHDLTSTLVEKFASLREQGVGDHEILRIHEITSKYGSNILVEIVEKGVQLSDIESDIQKLSGHLSELKTLESQTQGRIEGKQKSLAQLDSEVANFPNTVKEVQDSVQAAVSSIKSELEEFRKSAHAEIGSSDEKLKAFIDNAAKNLDSFIAEVKKLANNAANAGVEIGKLQGLAPLLGLVLRLEGEASHIHLATKIILEKYELWLTKQAGVKGDLMDNLQRLIQAIPNA